MRVWFNQLPFVRNKSDCQVMNRAVRIAFPGKQQPTRADLVRFAAAYKRGMSSLDLLNAVKSYA